MGVDPGGLIMTAMDSSRPVRALGRRFKGSDPLNLLPGIGKMMEPTLA